MKRKFHQAGIDTTGVLVKAYFLLSIVCLDAKSHFRRHRSEKLVGFYSKLVLAEIVAYMLLQHFTFY